MAYLFHDSFDPYATSGSMVTGLARWWNTVSGTISAIAGRISGFAAAMTAGADLGRALSSPVSTIIVGFSYKANSFTFSNANFLLFRDTGSNQCGLGISSTGILIAFRNVIGTVLATSSQALSPGVEYYIEVKVTIANAGGLFEVRLNGNTTPVISFSGDTQQTANATLNEYIFTAPTGSSGQQLDDHYALDTSGGAPLNDYLGDQHFQTLLPDGAGNYTQWTPNGAASNFQCVDEVPPNDDTDYVSSATAAQKDTYTMQATIGAPASIPLVVERTLARKTTAGVETYRNLIRSGGTDSPGSTVALSTSYAYYGTPFPLDPNGSVAWTQAAVDALEAGEEVV